MVSFQVRRGLLSCLSTSALNIPRSSPRAIKPRELIDALSVDPEGRTNPLLCSREHQDAQELFQLLSECIKREATAVDKEGLRDRGLGAISKTNGSSRHKNMGSTVFDGLTANRRSCVVCGYTEAVMHFSFDNWQLAVPRAVSSIISCHSFVSLSPLAVLHHLRLPVRLHSTREAHRLHLSKVFHACYTPETSRRG
jgi:hypothetical protein